MKILVFIFIILTPIFSRAGDSFNTKKQAPFASPVISLIKVSNYGFRPFPGEEPTGFPPDATSATSYDGHFVF